MDEQQFQSKDQNSLSLRELFYKYVRYLPLYILTLGLALFGAWLYLRYAQESYLSTGSLLINANNSSGKSGSNSKVEDIFAARNQTVSMQNEIEVLRSKPLLTRVVKKMGYELSHTTIGKIKDMNAYKRTSFTVVPEQIFDSSASFSLSIEFINANQFTVNGRSFSVGQVFETTRGRFKLIKNGEVTVGDKHVFTYTPADIAGARIIGGLSIQPKITGTNILSISYETDNPQLAADVINTLMHEYAVYSLERTNESMDSTLAFIARSMQILDRDIDSLKNKIVVFQKANQVIDPQAQIQEQMVRSGAQDEIAVKARMSLSVLNQIESYIKNKTSGRAIVPSTYGIEDAGLNSILEEYNKLKLERDMYREGSVPDENPIVKTLDEKLDVIRKTALDNIGAIKGNYQRVLNFASTEKAGLKQGAIQQTDKTFELIDLQSQLQFKRSAYNNFLDKQSEVLLTRVSSVANSQVVDKAEPNSTPVSPKRNVIRIIALLMGLALPTGIILLKELFNDKINTRNDIERVTNAPILGEISHSVNAKTMIVTRTNRSFLAEQFRILRSNLHYIIGKRDKAVLMVTSSFGGEGKSFISTNLAAAMALTDKKTIILEFDLRKPRILVGLALKRNAGISNFLAGDTNIGELIVPVADTENLYVLPCGPIPPNPSELLLTERMDLLFAQLRKTFDYIIIDTAPVGMVSDALTLGRFADCTIYVTRQGYTFKKQVALIDDMYVNKKLPHLSVVMNDVRQPTGGGYYGNYGYGYGYGYGEKNGNGYYEDEMPAKKGVLSRVFSSFNPRNWFKKN